MKRSLLLLTLVLLTSTYSHALERGIPDLESVERHIRENSGPLTPRQYAAIGFGYLNGHCIDQNCDKSRTLIWESAEKGYGIGHYVSATMYFNGIGVDQDYRLARYWTEKAAAQGDPDSQFNLGMMYFNGEGVDQDYRLAGHWLQQAAVQGDPDSQFGLGMLYFNGDGVDQDHTKAIYWIQKAKDQEHPAATSFLAGYKPLEP